jgi:hypothetical protein
VSLQRHGSSRDITSSEIVKSTSGQRRRRRLKHSRCWNWGGPTNSPAHHDADLLNPKDGQRVTLPASRRLQKSCSPQEKFGCILALCTGSVLRYSHSHGAEACGVSRRGIAAVCVCSGCPGTCPPRYRGSMVYDLEPQTLLQPIVESG